VRVIAFDEMRGSGRRGPHPLAALAAGRGCRPISSITAAARRSSIFRRIGITFAVYARRIDRAADPFDVHSAHPRGAGMGRLRRGLEQRVKALTPTIKSLQPPRGMRPDRSEEPDLPQSGCFARR